MISQQKKIVTKELLYAVVIVVYAFICITSGSFWGDEICRVEAPIFGSIKDVWRTAKAFAQPGYLFWITFWTRIIGTSEYVIRCSNIPFVFLQIYFAYKIVKKQNWPLEYIFFFFLHPMFAYYVDEATPYMVVYAFAIGFVYYVFYTNDQDFKYGGVSRAFRINLVFLLGVFFHFIFGFIFVLYIVHFAFIELKDKNEYKYHIVMLFGFLVIYIPLLYLYIDGLVHGASTRTGFGIKNIAFVIYAFLGMSGLGLSRNDLRAGNFLNLTWWHIVLLGGVCIALLLIIVALKKEWKSIIIKYKVMLLASISYFIIFFCVSKLINFGVWERHCMSVFPLYIIFVCEIITKIRTSNNLILRCAAGAYVIVLLISICNIRFNYYYSCDDYKGVYNEIATIAKENNNMDVLTSSSGMYYDFNKCLVSSNQKIIDTSEYDESKVLDSFENDNQAVLILFEKKVSKDFYHSFDNDPSVTINDRYNSFKIITRNK